MTGHEQYFHTGTQRIQKGREKYNNNIIIIFINCNWVFTRWQWLFNTYTKHEIGLLLNLRREDYMRRMYMGFRPGKTEGNRPFGRYRHIW
jgi:hypothetical protein